MTSSLTCGETLRHCFFHMYYDYIYVAWIMALCVVGGLGSCYFHDETLPIPMYAHHGIFSAAKNAVYLFGGITGTTWDDHSYPNRVYKWDLRNPSSWFVEIGSTPNQAPNTGYFGTWSKNAVLVNEKVFFIGMEYNDWRSGNFFVYDLNTESFVAEQKTPMPHPSIYGCLTTNATHIFLVDGRDGRTQRLPIIQVYDVAADTWQSQVLDAGPFISGGDGWYGQYCSLVGDALYVLGGTINRQQSNITLIDAIYRISTRTLEIEQLNASLPSPQGYGVSIYDHDQNLYLFGTMPFKKAVVTLNLDTLSVSTAFDSQQFYANAPVLTVNGSIYRFGGRMNQSDNIHYGLDQVEICDLPADNPTLTPTENPTLIPTAAPSYTPTDAPSTVSTRPSPAVNNSEYGVDTTIKLDAALPQNETDELTSALREYGHNTANITNCSERIDVSSKIEDGKTVVTLSIVTCSEATEKQLLLAFDETVLEYDIINVIVTEAEVEEIEIDGISDRDSDTKSDDASSSKPNENYEWLTVVVIVLVILLSGAMLCKCYVERRMRISESFTMEDEDSVERENERIANNVVQLSGAIGGNDQAWPAEEPGAMTTVDSPTPPPQRDTVSNVTAGGYVQENIAADEFVVEDDDADVKTTPGGLVRNIGAEVGEK